MRRFDHEVKRLNNGIFPWEDAILRPRLLLFISHPFFILLTIIYEFLKLMALLVALFPFPLYHLLKFVDLISLPALFLSLNTFSAF